METANWQKAGRLTSVQNGREDALVVVLVRIAGQLHCRIQRSSANFFNAARILGGRAEKHIYNNGLIFLLQ